MKEEVANIPGNDKQIGKEANLVCRRLDQDDLAMLLELERQCFSSVWGEKQLQAALDREDVFAAFGLLDEEAGLVGYCLVLRSAAEMEIMNIATAPYQRRQGLARLLLTHVLQWADKQGIKDILLEVRPSNAAALALYDAFGFEQISVRKGYYQDTGEDALLLRCDCAAVVHRNRV